MVQRYREVASCAPSRTKDAYVLSIVPLAVPGFLAALTSSNELVLLPPGDLSGARSSQIQGLPQQTATLTAADTGAAVICAGGHADGVVAIFDARSQAKVAQFKSGKSVTALASSGYDVAIGSEGMVSVWDWRQVRQRWRNSEVNDELTAVQFHPSATGFLLSGGDDGLVSVFDTRIAEEEDSLVQAVNHAPIHKAGFLGDRDLFALSSDQNLALHSLTFEDPDSAAPPPDRLGDVRPLVPCEYVIDILHTAAGHAIAAGSHSQSRVDLVKLGRGTGLDLNQHVALEAAHPGEVVRSIIVDEASDTIFTAGEDGRIAAFRPWDGTVSSPPQTNTSKAKKGIPAGADVRYKPY